MLSEVEVRCIFNVCKWWANSGFACICTVNWRQRQRSQVTILPRDGAWPKLSSAQEVTLGVLNKYSTQNPIVYVQWCYYRPPRFFINFHHALITLLSFISPTSGWNRVFATVTSSIKKSMNSKRTSEVTFLARMLSKDRSCCDFTMILTVLER